MNPDAAIYQLRRRCERQAIIDLLSAAAGNVSEAARLAGVHRRTFHRLMERHGIALTPARRVPIERLPAETARPMSSWSSPFLPRP